MVSLLPHPASFRFHLAMDTLAFGYILPTTGRIRDFHPLETCAAGRTGKLRNASVKHCAAESISFSPVLQSETACGGLTPAAETDLLPIAL